MASLEALNAKCIKLRRMQQLYSPEKFTAEMLAMNKTEYLQAVDKPYNDLLDIAEELESTPGMVGINGDEVERIVNTATQSHQQFLLDFNQKLGSACASPNTDNHGSNANLAQKEVQGCRNRHQDQR